MKKYLFILFQIDYDYDSPHDYADYLEPIIASSIKEYFSKIDTSELDGYENHLMIIDTDTNKEVKTILFSDNVSENIINAPENQSL